jgi:hypothetical protein
VARHHHAVQRLGADLAQSAEDPGLTPATDEEKNKARRVALLASRMNMALSIPMLFFMAGGWSHRAAFGL